MSYQFSLAKIHDDLENFEKAFKHLSEGNRIQKKLIKYNIKKDIELFNLIKLNFQKIEQISPRIQKNKIDLNQLAKKDKKIFSIYPGSRLSEIKVLTPILFEFIKLMNKNYNDLLFVLHSTSEFKKTIQNKINSPT